MSTGTMNDQQDNKLIRYDEFLEMLPYITTSRIHWLIANLKLELTIRDKKDEDNKKL